MFSTLPDLTPRDIHSLWYTPSRNPTHAVITESAPQEGNNHNNGTNPSRQRGQLIERTALHRLATDEFILSRRKHNVSNFGSHWLKPPGVPKTLHQMREEKREQEEHQEALRREQLAQELADAEAEAAGMAEGEMDDVQLDGAQDLDDEIPDAGDDFFMGGDSDEDEDEGEEAEEEYDDNTDDEEAIREERQNDLMAARMRMTDDAFREAIARGGTDGEDMYGGEEELEEEYQEHILDETDFAHDGVEDDGGIDMDADLDDDIPEAESGGYEHTDSEAELSSSDRSQQSDDGYGGDDAEGDSFGPRVTPMGPPQSPTHHSRSRSRQFAPRGSMEFSALLSQDGSSFMDSSPAQGRRSRQ
ncbi:unnamed protein product [Clonostachys byssicola]|uniref:Replicase polyprotein 1a n=1 Tax=Clonostachys byssicola TaxID=160290 RepID=A0A9N9UTY0_9HYPO|nr:unnamed protein product [Clonostachys byssicola]